MRQPADAGETRTFLGMANWHRRFIPKYSDVIEPLQLMTREGITFKWGEDQQRSFDSLKQHIIHAVTLAHPGLGTYHIYADASSIAAGYHIIQIHEGNKSLIAYGSTVFSTTERNYSTPKRELYAITLACKRFRH